MNLKSICIVIFVLTRFISVHAQSITKTVNRNNEFAFELLKEAYNKDNSICLSPYSISFALSMVYAGARNETAAQLSSVMHYDPNQLKSHEAFAEIQRQLNLFKGDTTIRLAMANAIWKKDREQVRQEYIDLLKKYYDAQVNPMTDAKTINDWVKSKTYNKISEIVSDENVKKSDLILTNAIYFKGDWVNAFDEKNTRKESFSINATNRNIVDMMYQQNTFNYYEDDYNQVLEMLYKGNQISMILILPKQESSIDELTQSINTSFDNYRYNLTLQKVNVFLPKFKFASEFELTSELMEMGLTNPFDAKADFSGMVPEKGVFISQVAHKTFIEVTEKGSEAAAATGVVVDKSTLNIIQEFNADRPFLFFIVDKQTGTILFMGSIINPTEVNDKNAKVYTGPRTMGKPSIER